VQVEQLVDYLRRHIPRLARRGGGKAEQKRLDKQDRAERVG
jgi:hypothetical protein